MNKNKTIRWNPQTVKLSEKGIARFLGKREAEILEVVWDKGEVSVRDVCSELCKKREFSFNTIMTIMNRLAEKGLLKKSEKNNVFCYKAISSKSNLLARLAENIFNDLIKDKELVNNKTTARLAGTLKKKI